MPELPDITVYIEALEKRTVGQRLMQVRVTHPFLVRSVDPPMSKIRGKMVNGYRRIGKRIVMALEDELFLVLHLMIAGRLQWKTSSDAKPPGRRGLAAFGFESGTLILTEAGGKRRASLHAVRGEQELVEHDPGGLEVLDLDLEAFRGVLLRENHSVKRALTDPRILSGIGNAYSDEILHRARLSPVKWTERLTDDEFSRLHDATQTVLSEWIGRLREEMGDGFPEKVTAFRPEMAVHGKYREPCPVCDSPVQRIVYASNESNYCPTCQTDGKLLADRALSKLLKGNWPKTLEEMEERRVMARSHGGSNWT